MKRSTWRAAILVAVVAAFLAIPGVTLAHHSEIGGVECVEFADESYLISGTATAWNGSTEAKRTNPSIEVHRDSYSGPLVASGEFNVDNGFTFGWEDSLSIGTVGPVTYFVIATEPWGSGEPPRGEGNLHPAQTAVVDLAECVPNPDPDPDPDPDPSVTDLAVTKTGPADPVAEGSQVVYTITANNNGPLDEPATVVTDTLPDTFTFVSATPSQGTCTEAFGVVTCDLGPLNVGDSATVVVTAETTKFGRYTNAVVVAGQVTDSNLANNQDTEDTDVIVVSPTTVTTSSTTSTSVAVTSETLPVTGAGASGVGGIGAALLAFGGLVVLALRRREEELAPAGMRNSIPLLGYRGKHRK